MPLEFQELEHRNLLGLAQFPSGVPVQKLLDTPGRSVENDLDVVVSSRPRILQKPARRLLIARSQHIPEPIHGLPQRGPPGLVPSRMPPGVAAAVASPSLQPVGTAPRGTLHDLYLVGRRILLQVLAVVGEASEIIGLKVVEGIGQRHLPKPMMVAVGLAVGSDVDELGPGSRLGKGIYEATGQVFAFCEQPLESDCTRNRAVVKEEVQFSARGQAQLVGRCRVDVSAADAPPGAATDRPHPAGLMGCEDREPDRALGQNVKGLVIHRRLWKTHPLWLPAEAMLEIADTLARSEEHT